MKTTLRGTFGAVEIELSYGKLADTFTADTPLGVFTMYGESVRTLTNTLGVLEQDAKTKA